MMAAARSKDTKPELLVRRELHARGYRFRLHRRDLPGTPDTVFPSRKSVIFVNGCFWHGHECPSGALPATSPPETGVVSVTTHVRAPASASLVRTFARWSGLSLEVIGPLNRYLLAVVRNPITSLDRLIFSGCVRSIWPDGGSA